MYLDNFWHSFYQIQRIQNHQESLEYQWNITSVTIPSLFLSNALRNKSDERRIFIKFSFPHRPSFLMGFGCFRHSGWFIDLK